MGNLYEPWVLRWLDNQWALSDAASTWRHLYTLADLTLLCSQYQWHSLGINTTIKAPYLLHPPVRQVSMYSEQVWGSMHTCGEIYSEHLSLSVSNSKAGEVIYNSWSNQQTKVMCKQITQIQCPRQFFGKPKIKVWGFLECVCEQGSNLSAIQGSPGVQKKKTRESPSISCNFQAS